MKSLEREPIIQKHKGINKNVLGMDFDRYARKILSLKDIYNNFSAEANHETKLHLRRFQVKDTNMKMTSNLKSCFSSLNVKRYYLSDGIASLPFGHPLFENTRKIKKEFKKQIHKHVHKIKDKLLREKHKISIKNERIRILMAIFKQPFTYYKINSNKRHHSTG